MSKAELFKMHVYMCVCLYRDIILLTYYSCCRSLFKTSLYLFLWKYSSRKITDLSPCPFQWLLRSLFVTSWWASVQFPSLCHEWTGSWRAWFILMVLVVGTSETCCTTPISFLVSALALPCGDDREQRHQDTRGMIHGPLEADLPVCCTGTVLPWAKLSSLPSELRPGISASCRQYQPSEAASHSGLFWLKIGDNLIEMKIQFWMCRNLIKHWTFPFFPFDAHYLKDVQNFWISGVDVTQIKLTPHCPLLKRIPEVLFIILHLTK